MKNITFEKLQFQLNLVDEKSLGDEIKTSQEMADFILENNLQTGNKFRNMQMWCNEYEFAYNGNLYILIYPDNLQGILIQRGSHF